MGMQEWKGGTTPLRLIISATFIFLPLSVDAAGSGCNVRPCWERYQEANTYYQVDVPGISDQQARKCTVLRTYKACLNSMDISGCAGNLYYRGAGRVLRNEFLANNCTEEGPLYPEGPAPQRTEPVTPCKFKGRPVYSYCMLFGDPHLVTFHGGQMTCKLEGAWPLIDNEFLTVQVTNSPLSASTRAATVTQKVTVVVKGRGSSSPSGAFCGSREAVFYSAEIGSLPGTFSDGMKEYGSYSSIQVKTVTPGEQVEIYLRYIDSTVIIRQINNQYLSVGVRIPENVLNDTIHNPEINSLRQLCVDSCPISEIVNIGQHLANISTGSSVQRASYAAAQKSCRDNAVTDFFFDSCVFDLLMTGEQLFSNMANNAYEDVKKYASRQPRWSNRTHLEQYTRSLQTDQRQPADPSNSLAAAGPSSSDLLLRTLLFVYIMHVMSL